jgi:GNAT superfamily N-acetyltransferase
MSDMLVRLYNLPPLEPAIERAKAAGITVRRAESWERRPVLQFVAEQFSEKWADEVCLAYARHPLSLFVADDAGEIVGFAAYHTTRLDFFGPEGVREDYRGKGLGAALLLSCLWALHYEGYGYAVIGWAGPVDFYRKCCGATIIEDSEPGVYQAIRRG